MAKARLSQDEVKRKIAGFVKQLKKETDKKKRRILQQRISKYRHYDENIIKSKERQMRKKEEQKTRILSKWDLEMWDIKKANVKFDVSPFKRYMKCENV